MCEYYKWEYHKENIGTGKVVATLRNRNGVKILDVYEGINFLYIMSGHSFIKPIAIDYSEISRHVNSEQLGNVSRAEQMLYQGCKLVENRYKEQVESLKKIIF